MGVRVRPHGDVGENATFTPLLGGVGGGSRALGLGGALPASLVSFSSVAVGSVSKDCGPQEKCGLINAFLFICFVSLMNIAALLVRWQAGRRLLERVEEAQVLKFSASLGLADLFSGMVKSVTVDGIRRFVYAHGRRVCLPFLRSRTLGRAACRSAADGSSRMALYYYYY